MHWPLLFYLAEIVKLIEAKGEKQTRKKEKKKRKKEKKEKKKKKRKKSLAVQSSLLNKAKQKIVSSLPSDLF